MGEHVFNMWKALGPTPASQKVKELQYDAPGFNPGPSEVEVEGGGQGGVQATPGRMVSFRPAWAKEDHAQNYKAKIQK